MATTFESAVKTIRANEEVIFPILSDLRNLEKLKDRIPQDKIRDLFLEKDYVSFTVDSVGAMRLGIIDREPPKTIKFKADKSPIDFNLWIQLKQVAEKDTKIKVVLRAELNPIFKAMASKPLEQFVNMLVDALSKIPIDDNSN